LNYCCHELPKVTCMCVNYIATVHIGLGYELWSKTAPSPSTPPYPTSSNLQRDFYRHYYALIARHLQYSSTVLYEWDSLHQLLSNLVKAVMPEITEIVCKLPFCPICVSFVPHNFLMQQAHFWSRCGRPCGLQRSLRVELSVLWWPTIIQTVNLSMSKFAVSPGFCLRSEWKRGTYKIAISINYTNYYHTAMPPTSHFNSNFDSFVSFASDPLNQKRYVKVATGWVNWSGWWIFLAWQFKERMWIFRSTCFPILTGYTDILHIPQFHVGSAMVYQSYTRSWGAV